MHRVLYLLSILALADGAYSLSQAPTITQQTAGLVILLIAAVLFGSAAIVQAVVGLAQKPDPQSERQLTHEEQARALAESWNRQPTPQPPQA